MIRLAISVEGPTEEEFVKRVLADHLRPMEVIPTPILLGRARNDGVGGGNVNINRLTSEMAHCYRSFDFVTSRVDFHGFRDKGSRTVEELEQYLHQEIRTRIPHGRDERKVIPYVQRHEFEGLLFSDVKAFGTAMDAPDQSIARLIDIRSRFPTPEDINDNPDTAPSKRIVNAISNYRKRLHGPLVATEVGLSAIRAECPRFNDWLTRMESLSNPPMPN